MDLRKTSLSCNLDAQDRHLPASHCYGCVGLFVRPQSTSLSPSVIVSKHKAIYPELIDAPEGEYRLVTCAPKPGQRLQRALTAWSLWAELS